MSQTNVNIRMDEKLKKEFDKFCSDVGMTMTTAICIFAKITVKEQKIPFEITADPFYNSVNIKRLEKAIKDVEEDNITIHELEEKEVDG